MRPEVSQRFISQPMARGRDDSVRHRLAGSFSAPWTWPDGSSAVPIAGQHRNPIKGAPIAQHETAKSSEASRRLGHQTAEILRGASRWQAEARLHDGLRPPDADIRQALLPVLHAPV